MSNGPFGVRRPLRFLAHKLGLEESQVATLASVIDDLKTERAQSAVDDRRVQTLFTAAFAAEEFDKAKAEEARRMREASHARVQEAVIDALERTHAILTAEQRELFTYLIRAGALQF